MLSAPDKRNGRGVFATAHWSTILQAGSGDSPVACAAVERLCSIYWYPPYTHVRRRGHRQNDAPNLTQERSNPPTVYDIHATMLHLHGIDRRLTDVHGLVVKGILV